MKEKIGAFIAFGIYGQRLIDAWREAQANLRLANAELTQIFETSADGMRVVDREFNMLRANNTFCVLAEIVEHFKNISARKEREEELKQSRRQLRELASYLESAREKERTRIAREIHDELGQVLTGLKMELHCCIQRLPEDDPWLMERTKKLLELIDDNVRLVQRISSELRPGLLDNLGLSAAIE